MPRMRFGFFGAVGTHGLGFAIALALLLVVPACGAALSSTPDATTC